MEEKETSPADAAIEVFQRLYSELLEKQEPLPPEFQKILDDNFWDLID